MSNAADMIARCSAVEWLLPVRLTRFFPVRLGTCPVEAGRGPIYGVARPDWVFDGESLDHRRESGGDRRLGHRRRIFCKRHLEGELHCLIIQSQHRAIKLPTM